MFDDPAPNPWQSSSVRCSTRSLVPVNVIVVQMRNRPPTARTPEALPNCTDHQSLKMKHQVLANSTRGISKLITQK
jgi:hypothetical protein